MNAETRSKYAEYIAEAIRFSIKETGLKWPEETILVVKSYSSLAEIDEIIGVKIFVMDMPSSYEFSVAFPSCYNDEYKLQKAFNEYQEIYSLDT